MYKFKLKTCKIIKIKLYSAKSFNSIEIMQNHDFVLEFIRIQKI